ncbi:MAG: helix-turn-helix domain-containing protein [Pirellulales bacterium]|nr:helix-turn-helix domain-containing protein [Pirellulales bacterium]
MSIYRQPQPKPTKPILVNAKQAAKLLSICLKTLRKKTREGEIPAVKLGRRVLYRPKQLNAWLDGLQAQPVNGGAI